MGSPEQGFYVGDAPTAAAEQAAGRGAERAPQESARAFLKRLENRAGLLRMAALERVERPTTRAGPDGWYEDVETGEKWRLTAYKNPEQARVAWLANAIYEWLGVAVPESALIEKDGLLALAEKEIPGASPADRQSLASDPEFRRGLLADALLANADIVGNHPEDIVRDFRGRAVRARTAATMTFAPFGVKRFAADAVPELDAYRAPGSVPGDVFVGVGDDELRPELARLRSALDQATLDRLIQASGLEGELAAKLRSALLGRCAALVKRFISAEQADARGEGIADEIDKRLAQESGRLEGLTLWPRAGVLADGASIENQQLDIIDARENKTVIVQFKLTEPVYQKVLQLLREDLQSGIQSTAAGEITYRRGEQTYFSAPAIIRDLPGGVRFAVALDTEAKPECNCGQCKATPIRSVLGLVQLEAPSAARDAIVPLVAEVFKDLGIGEAVVPPPEAERDYKRARYAWQHKLEPAEVPSDALERLKRREVVPNYFTFVDPGRGESYFEQSPFAVSHEVRNPKNLPGMIRTGGVYATHECYRRGLGVDGWSSEQDMKTGGADSVFTRIIRKTDWNKNRSGVYFLFDPSILDRTDWYAYRHDMYGSTDPEKFKQRISPAQIFASSPWDNDSNEEMFRNGIAFSDVVAIACGSSLDRNDVLYQLRSAGIAQINGRPVEEMVVIAAQANDLIRITSERRVKSLTPKANAPSNYA